MKFLIIVRHAKSSWNNVFCSDFDRGLNKRGKSDLVFMSELLGNEIKKPDYIVASPSKRTKKTACAFANARGYKKKHIKREESMYESSLGTLVRVIEHIDENINHLMLVGHNPGLTELVNYCGYSLDNLPTCGIVVFKYIGDLRGNFEPKKCSLNAQYFPKEIAGLQVDT